MVSGTNGVTLPKRPMGRPAKVRLRTTEDVLDAFERLIDRQFNGQVDSRTANSILATILGSRFLIADLPAKQAKMRLDAAKLYLTAKSKKIAVPKKMLPESIEE